MTGIHPVRRVAGVVAISPSGRRKRVLAVLWEDHDPLTCDGQDLAIETDGWFDCPVSLCRWTFDPETSCPEHGGSPS